MHSMRMLFNQCLVTVKYVVLYVAGYRWIADAREGDDRA